jgi:hypothetical protein
VKHQEGEEFPEPAVDMAPAEEKKPSKAKATRKSEEPAASQDAQDSHPAESKSEGSKTPDSHQPSGGSAVEYARYRTAPDLGHGYRLGMSIAQCDSCRIPVPYGTVSIGDILAVQGAKREIVKLSSRLQVSSDQLEDMRSRFPHVDIPKDFDYQFAMWAFEE